MLPTTDMAEQRPWMGHPGPHCGAEWPTHVWWCLCEYTKPEENTMSTLTTSELNCFATHIGFIHLMKPGELIRVSCHPALCGVRIYRNNEGEYYVDDHWVGNVHGAVQAYTEMVAKKARLPL